MSQETLVLSHMNKKGANEPLHLHSLDSACICCVIPSLEAIMSRLLHANFRYSSKSLALSRLYLVMHVPGCKAPTQKPVSGYKIRKKAKIKIRHNQESHMTQNTTWKNDKNIRKHHTQKSQEVSPFPAGDHKAAKNRQESMTDKKHK